MEVCYQNLLHAQELQKRAHDKGVKSRSYTPSKQIWLNSKYIKTKRIKKLESKFVGPFWVVHAVGKQVYKLELPTKLKIYNVFHVSLLEYDTTKKGQVDNKALPELEKELKFESRGNKKYEIEAIINSTMYSLQANNQMTGFYYLVLWKGYPEEEHTWEPSSAVIHLRKFISTFRKKHPEKLTATFSPLDSAPPMARPSIPKKPKRKRGRPSKGVNKRGRKVAVHLVALDVYVVLKPLIQFLVPILNQIRTRVFSHFSS